MNATRRAALALSALACVGLGTLIAFPPPGGGFRPPPPPVRPPTTVRPPVTTPPPITRPPTGGGASGIMRPPARPPAEIHVGLRSQAKNNPTGAIRELRGPEARTLTEAARLEVARDAARALAQRVEASRDAAGAMREVNQARAEAASLPEAMRKPLDRLHETTHRRLLHEALGELATLAEGGKWAEANGRAEEWGRTLRASGGSGAEHDGAVAACRAVAEVGARSEAVERFQSALEGKGRIDPEGLPAPLAKQAEVVRGLAELREAAGHKGTRPPLDLARLEQTLTRLEELAEPALMKRVALDLAVKALIEGRTAEFERLMPADVAPEAAARALRDLKALALGAGKVETWPGKEAVPDGPAPRPPPGVEPLVPEGKREGWRPPVKEKGTAGLPPLEEAAALGKKVAGEATAGAKAERTRLEGEAGKAREVIATARAKVQAADRAEGRRFAFIEHRLDRRLTSSERVRARDLIDDGKDAEAVVKALRDEAADPGEVFLEEVTRLLRRPLTDDEKAQARRLRREGRRASEVAELLRV